MIIGIKYCKGCKPAYDRVKRVKKLKTLNSEHEYILACDDMVCDIWIVVCGCMEKCEGSERLRARQRVAVLWDEESFRLLEQELALSDQAGMSRVNEKRILHLHDKAVMTKTMTKKDTVRFARLTGDESRLHLDQDTAWKAGYHSPLVHGMYIDSLVSAVMGTMLPGNGTIYMEHDVRFIRPAYHGDVLEITVEFTSYVEQEDCYIGMFRATCKNQKRERVLMARCSQKLLKNLFGVVKEGAIDNDQSGKV